MIIVREPAGDDLFRAVTLAKDFDVGRDLRAELVIVDARAFGNKSRVVDAALIIEHRETRVARFEEDVRQILARVNVIEVGSDLVSAALAQEVGEPFAVERDRVQPTVMV